MELRQLQTFQEVAQAGSFTRAADILNYAQSSVSAQIQTLEEELQVQLFDRLGRKTVLTEAGTRLLNYADRILEMADEATIAVVSDDEPVGRLTITVPETLCAYRLPAVLQPFRTQYPRVELIFQPNSTRDDWRRKLIDGAGDAAIVIDVPLQSDMFVVETLIREPLFVLAHPEHPLADGRTVRLTDLQDQSLLLTESGCTYRIHFERHLRNACVLPAVILEFHSVEAIKQCAIGAMGIAVLPEIAVSKELSAGDLVALPWGGPELTMYTQILWHKDKWISPALGAFLETTRSVLGQSS